MKFKAGLQEVLDHNTYRIFEDPDFLEHVKRLTEENGGELEIFHCVKIGFDGTGLGDIGKTKHSMEGSERDEGKLMTSHVVCLNMVTLVNEQLHILYSNNTATVT